MEAPATDVALDLPGVEFEAGMVYGIYAVGRAAEDTLTVLSVVAPAMAPAMATPSARVEDRGSGLAFGLAST